MAGISLSSLWEDQAGTVLPIHPMYVGLFGWGNVRACVSRINLFVLFFFLLILVHWYASQGQVGGSVGSFGFGCMSCRRGDSQHAIRPQLSC